MPIPDPRLAKKSTTRLAAVSVRVMDIVNYALLLISLIAALMASSASTEQCTLTGGNASSSAKSVFLISAAFFLFFTTLKELFIKKFNNISQTISHFGFSILILSILFNSILSSEIITNIKIGERYDYNKGEIFFKKIEEKKESNFNSIIASFEIKDKNGKTIELKPEIRIYNQPVIITSEADIRTTLLEDKFLVMNLVKGNEYFNIRYQVKPFMVWIWISVLLLCLGGLMSLFKRKI